MLIRKAALLALGLTFATTALSGSAAHAAGPLNFNFSFTGTSGTATGTVTGEIFGLTNNATGPAADVRIFTAPAGFGIPPTFDLGAGNTGSDSFTIANGIVTGAAYTDTSGNYSLSLNSPSNSLIDTAPALTDANSGGFGGATYSAAVPEPATLSLLAIGALPLVRRRRRIV